MKEVKLGKYRHYKGNEYEVLGVGRHSETLESMVIYQAQYGEKELWVRPVGMFTEMLTKDGKTFPRFSFIDQ